MAQIIHISDTHFGPSKEMEIRGSRPYERVSALVDLINGMTFTPDLIIHTGDIVNDPDEDAYALARDVLGQLNAPVYYVSGNHDDAAMTRKYMALAPHTGLNDVGDKLAYTFDIGTGVTGLVIDAWVPETEGPHGFVSDPQLRELRSTLESLGKGERLAIFLHYPILPIGSPWTDDFLLVKNGLAVHYLLCEFRDHVAGVFFGHLHRGIQVYRDGILYSGVSSPVCHFSSGPEETVGCDFISKCALPFNHITFTSEATMVKEYAEPHSL